MILFRRRLIIWLIKEYFKKWKKAIFLFFVLGILTFFLLRLLISYFNPKIQFGSKEIIGIVGAYTIDSLPDSILHEIARGLTIVDKDGLPKADLARSWTIKDNGKTYIFKLKDGLFFNDGTPLTSNFTSYNFFDTLIERPDNKTIIFKLKDQYSPFLVTVSRPILKDNFIGVGNYKIKNIKLNGNFVASLVLSSLRNVFDEKTYHFYPSIEALKTAFVLGEVSRIEGLPNDLYKNKSFLEFSNVAIEKKINYKKLVTLFYNTQDKILSEEKIRNALSYALPTDFKEGERNYSPFSPLSWVYSNEYVKLQDFEHADLLLKSSSTASSGATLKLNIKTLPIYKEPALLIAKTWKNIGIEIKIEAVDSVPSQFQIFLGDFYLPKDPDQYMLWHQNQESNITHFKNLRIDKLLEDGRKTVDIEARKQIYNDFQKYLLNDSPASFLYFPYEYEIKKKR